MNLFSKILFVFHVLFLSPNFSWSQKTEAELDKTLQYVIDNEKLVGFSVSLFSKDEIFYSKGFGYADYEKKIPYTSKTNQTLASISKTTIAVSLLKCQELGLLDLDDPINKHLPFEIKNPHYPNIPITIRHLTNHTSGLKYSMEMTDIYAYENPDFTLEDFIKAYLTPEGKWYQKTNFHQNKPGKRGDYSNVSASLAAYVVEQCAKMSFAEFTTKYIFDPLQLEKTKWFTGEIEEGQSKHYHVEGFGKFKEHVRVKDGLYPAGDLVSNAEELTKYCQMVMNGGSINGTQILSATSVKEMLKCKKIKTTEGGKVKIATFWFHDKDQLGIPRKVIGHDGGDDGIFSMMYYDPKADRGYILLSNSGKIEENHLTMVLIYQSMHRFGKTIDD